MASDIDATAPLLVINPQASRVRDPDRRRAIVDLVADAIRARSGRPPVIVDDTQDAAEELLSTVDDTATGRRYRR